MISGFFIATLLACGPIAPAAAGESGAPFNTAQEARQAALAAGKPCVLIAQSDSPGL